MKSRFIFSFIILILITTASVYFYTKYKNKLLSNKDLQIDNYTLVTEIDGDIIDSKVRLYKHNKTQATIVYFYNPNEDNNVFTIGFRTTPFDDTGVFHILEHSVLGGSTKYPLKGTVVFDLMRSYITTFINAMTFPDKTIYPISSTNKASFTHLSNVYMDAVFSPLLTQIPAIFYREAVRKDFDEKSNIRYNGIVYNEMLANINKDFTMELQIFKSLFPNTGYVYNYGGDPEFIPDLTYEKFIETYNKFYYPSNALIYFYGNVDIKERLTYLDQNYLSNYEYKEPEIPTIPPLEDNPNPTPVIDYYPAEASSSVDKDSSIIYGYRTNFDSFKDKVAFKILLDTIFNSEASSYKKELLSICKCANISAKIENAQQILFYIHVNGVSPKNQPLIKNTLDTLFNKILEQGFNEKLLSSVLNEYLFSLKSITSSNLGMNKYGDIIYEAWIATQDPLYYLNEDKVIEDIQQTLEQDTSYFTTLLKTHIIDNNKKYIGIISPSTTVLTEKQQRISAKLKQEISKLSDSDKEQIKKINEDIKVLASSNDSDSSFKLPSLSQEDLIKNEYKFALLPKKDTIKLDSHDLTLFSYDSLYDDIDHIYLMFGLSHLTDEDFLNLALLDTLLQRISTKNYSSEKLNQAINLYGSVSTSITSYKDKDKKHHFYYMLSLDFLPSNLNSILELGLETLYNTIFTDKDKIKQILNETLYNIEQEANSDPIWSEYLPKLVNASAYDYTEGKYFVKKLKNLIKNFDKNFNTLVHSLQNISQKVFVSNIPMIAVVSKSEEGISNLKDTLLNNDQKLLSYLKLSSSSSLNFNPIVEKKYSYIDTGYIIPQNTSYSIRATNLSNIDPSIEITGDFTVLQKYIQKYLINKIRLESGAYGTGITLNRDGSIFLFSYRDPNIVNTNHTFKTLTDIFKNPSITDQEEFNFKVAAISSIDSPSTPKGYSISSIDRFLSGRTEEDVYKYREEILNTSLKATMEKNFELFKKAIESSHLSTAAGKDMLEKNKKLYKKIVPLVEE